MLRTPSVRLAAFLISRYHGAGVEQQRDPESHWLVRGHKKPRTNRTRSPSNDMSCKIVRLWKNSLRCLHSHVVTTAEVA